MVLDTQLPAKMMMEIKNWMKDCWTKQNSFQVQFSQDSKQKQEPWIKARMRLLIS